jgi:tetratricopeptide (TPR) repeat protein
MVRDCPVGGWNSVPGAFFLRYRCHGRGRGGTVAGRSDSPVRRGHCPKLPAGTRVAVVAFESPEQNLSGYIMDEIAGELTGGSLEVADRNNLEYVYKELDFQMSGEVDDESAQALGKFLAARYVITGQLVNLGGRYRYRLNGINVQTAIHESSTRLDVWNDRGFEMMLAALRDAVPVVRTASYGAGKAPETPGRFLDRGITFACRGEYEMAIANFTQALALDPDLFAAWMLRGRALYASVSKVTSVGENFSSVDTVIVRERAITADGKMVYDRAIADYSQAIQLDPDYAPVYSDRGNVYSDKKDYDRAIADYSQAIRLNPNFVEAYSERGSAYNGKKDYDRAIADYDQAIRLDPNFVTAYNNRGNAYNDKKDYDRAIADYDQAIRLDPDYAAVYTNRGAAYNGKNDYDRAIADLNQAIRLDPDYALAYNNRGDAYKGKKDYDRAITDYSQAIRLNPNYVTAYFNRGNVYGIKEDYDRSIDDFNQVIRFDPDDADAYGSRGWSYYLKGDYRHARADWEQVLRINPNDTSTRNTLERLRQMGY